VSLASDRHAESPGDRILALRTKALDELDTPGGSSGRTTAHCSSLSRTPLTPAGAAHPVPFRNSF
jgi:hypothetical protein